MPVNPLNSLQKFLTRDVVRLEVATDLPNASGLLNYVPNPSGDLGAWSWWSTTAGTLVDPSGNGAQGGLRVLQYIGMNTTSAATAPFRVRAGEWVSGRFKLLSLTAGRNVKARFAYYDRDRALISAGAFSVAMTSTGATYYVPTEQAPAGTFYAAMYLLLYNGTGTPSANDAFVVRDVMTTKAAAAINPTYAYVDPNGWTNILNTATDITINRATLDAGTMTATVLDPALDPSTSAALSRGRRVRVTTYVSALDSWEPIFTGTITTARTDYLLRKGANTYQSRITITANDAAADLANYPQPDGYASSQGLCNAFGKVSSLGTGSGVNVPWSLEDAGGGFGYPQSPDSTNSKASLLDQIAITRDSLGMALTTGGPGGQAWVARDGVLNVWANVPGRATTTALSVPDNYFSTINATSTTSTGVVDPHGITSSVYRLTATAAGTIGAWTYRTVKPGQVIDVSGWVRNLTTARNARIGLIYYNRAYSTPVDAAIIVATTTEAGWKQAAGRTTVPLDAFYVEAYLYIDNCVAGEQHYVDELVIAPVPVTYSNTNPTTATTDSYSDITIDYLTSACINSVKVNYLRAVAMADSTTVAYGPYEDMGSVDANGRYATTLTLTGVETAARIRGTARALLAANADPVRTVENLTVPVLDNYGRHHAALVDLCDQVEVIYAGLIDSLPRVASINHHITPVSWIATYGFEPSATLAHPQQVPTP